MKAKCQGAALSDLGRRRAVNEDSFFFDDSIGLYVVADGMGGHAAGEVASEQAAETIYNMVKGDEAVRKALASDPGPDDLQRGLRLLESAVQAATYMVFGIAQHQPEQKGMGTTVSALLITGTIGITAQVGDSRVYRVRNGQTELITEDHTLVAWQIKQGLITEQQAAYSPHRNVITRAVGSKDYVEVDTAIVDVQDEDRFLVCSDGLHGYLTSAEISEVCSLAPEIAVNTFINMANERGGSDNITAIVTRVHLQ